MAKKNRNKIFEQQTEEEKVVDAVLEGVAESLTRDTKLISSDEKIVLTKDIDGSRHFDLAPDESKESMVENVPDDPTQMDMLNDKLSQISQLNAELNTARQTIAQLETEIKNLKSTNDQLIIKLAEQSAAMVNATNTNFSHKPNPSKNVNYIRSTFNNGYGTWH